MLNQDELQGKKRGELIQLLSLTQNKITSQEQTIEQLQEYIRLLKHGKFGASSEQHLDKNPQSQLFDEAVLPENTAEIESAEEDIMVLAHKRKKPGRKPLSKDLPRKQIVYDLSDDEKRCDCGCDLTHIGDETTEQLDIIPAKIYVIQHVCKKYACKACSTGVKTAKKPTQPIPKSVAAPGLLAHVLTSKFQFHLPLYRQEQMLKNIGADIPRNTLSLWVIRCSELLQPLVNLIQDEILDYDIAYADESTVQVLKEQGKTPESKSYMWVFGGGPPERFSFLYQYHPNRVHQIAIDFFNEFKGYLHCDGYQAYDNLCKVNKDVKQAGCWYHARRKFKDASKVSKKPGESDWFLKQIKGLAKIEKTVADNKFNPEQTRTYRLKHAPEIITGIKNKLDALQHVVPPQGLLGKAVHYMLNQWPKLEVYLEDGRLEISNNRLERAIKPFALGRRNWLFANSVDGAKAAANIFSLIETCKAHKVNPYDWLRDTLTKIPACETVEQFEALMPFRFEKESGSE